MLESLEVLWILSCDGALWLAYGREMVLLRCLLMPEILYKEASDVFLY
jgi:hypothetical protein